MTASPDLLQGRVSTDGVVILARTGRLASWYALSEAERDAANAEHVALMLRVAREHGMRRLDGFRLVAPQGRFERFWLIGFAATPGAEAWMDAEMRPPYGLYGYYEYDLSRAFAPDRFASWVSDPLPRPARTAGDPHDVPELGADPDHIVVVMFERMRPSAAALDPRTRGDAGHERLLRRLAHEHGLRSLEVFQLMAPRDDWHRAWVAVFPSLAGAETWIEAQGAPPFGNHSERSFLLARRWEPGYFASWVLDTADAPASGTGE